MILVAANVADSQRPEISYIESGMLVDRPTKVSSGERPSHKKVPYKLDRRVLSLEGGKLLLFLREPILVELDPSAWTGEVQGWSVTVPAGEIQELPRILARKFLTLFSKADSDGLSAEERAEWVSILDRVDYRRFSIDRAPARYVEGELIDRQPEYVRVRWHDGSVQKVPRPLGGFLDVLKIGDEFGCYAKIGLNNEVSSLERLTILETA